MNMRRGIPAALVTLFLAGLAHAQELPPPATPAPPMAPPPPPSHGPPPTAAPVGPPAAAPAPPPVRLTRYSRYRTSWYIGFGIGGGGGWVSDKTGYRTDSVGGVALTVLKVGWVATPWFLVGFEGGAWRHDDEDGWVQYNHYDLVATFFPIFDIGLYGKAGVGAGVAMFGAKETILGTTVSGETDTGFDLKLGVGYEWQLLSSFNLGADLSYAMTAYEGGRTHDLTAQLTFTWY